jgi:branched-subunit amino acid transport protein
MENFFTGHTSGWNLLTIAGLACVTVLSRSFFFLSDTEWHLPQWVQKGLQYAPIAALAAVVLPEIVMTHGALIQSLRDARIYGALAGMAYFAACRHWGQGVLGTIVTGMAVYLPLHVGWGW